MPKKMLHAVEVMDAKIQLSRNRMSFLFDTHVKADKCKLCLSRAEIEFRPDFKGKIRICIFI